MSLIPNYTVSREREFMLGSVNFHLTEYRDPDSFQREFHYRDVDITLPLQLVTGLVNLSYSHIDQKQAILDALSPYQIASKLWATRVIEGCLSEDRFYPWQCVLPGSWYGQQASLLARSRMQIQRYLLIDKDPKACAVAARLIVEADGFNRKDITTVIDKSIFTCGAPWNEWSKGPTLFVWNGLEHFDRGLVQKFLSDNPYFSFCLQSTNFQDAEGHETLCTDIQYLLDYVPESHHSLIRYAGELQTNLGSRYMVLYEGLKS